MSSVDHHSNGDYSSQPRGFLTPPPSWGRRRCSPVMPASEKHPKRSPLFHVIHKVPSGDSPYVRAKHAQLIDKDPSRAISLFWAAINSGDRVDSALKDMAVVMKQLDRSDEAIEAIKSFRHLCPYESQESIDNILVELYKQSGRIEEEIEMLQIKLKQVEEGIAFGGRRKKMARSQGKKIHITVEKEYSRLLGNLAWAYMQQKDFKSAEEHYRKALSFESDKNKQCNLAICLMHMNKLTEAKFMLQSIKASSENGRIDESHAKSYERAYQMLVEFESQRGLNPMKQTRSNNESGMDIGFAEGNNGFCCKKYGTSTDFPYEKRADYSWRKDNHQGQEEAFSQLKRVHESPSCHRVIPRAPFTQPRRCPRSGDPKMGGFMDHGYGFSCRKLSFGSSVCSGNAHAVVNQNGSYYYTGYPSEIPRVIPLFLEKNFPSTPGDWRKNSSDNLGTNSGTAKLLETNEERINSLAYDQSGSSVECRNSDKNSGEGCMLTSVVSNGTYERNPNLHSTCEHKSWADMVEEDEQDLERFNDENLNCNIIQETPKSMDQAERLNQMIERIDLGSGYLTQPEKTTLQMNQSTTARRSLCFGQNHNSPLTTKVLNFEGQDVGTISEDSSSTKRRNRLQVFQDITP